MRFVSAEHRTLDALHALFAATPLPTGTACPVSRKAVAGLFRAPAGGPLTPELYQQTVQELLEAQAAAQGVTLEWTP